MSTSCSIFLIKTVYKTRSMMKLSPFYGTIGNKRADTFQSWKANESMYPNIAAIARDTLSAQASSITSEHYFPTTGNLVDISRSRLKDQSIFHLCLLGNGAGFCGILRAVSLFWFVSVPHSSSSKSDYLVWLTNFVRWSLHCIGSLYVIVCLSGQ